MGLHESVGTVALVEGSSDRGASLRCRLQPTSRVRAKSSITRDVLSVSADKTSTR